MDDRGPVRPQAITAAWLGLFDYEDAWALQRELWSRRRDGAVTDHLLLLEHPHTYTLGRRSKPHDVLLDDAQRAARRISMYEVDRGGRATYHGPGQLVGYPIFALGARYDIIGYLRRLEESLIRTARDLGVRAHRDRHTGVWVRTNKLAALGVRFTRGVTMHGFALNVTTDLSMFEGIVPCGLSDRWVTSIQHETGAKHSVREVARVVGHHIGGVFGRPVVWDDDAAAPAASPKPAAVGAGVT